MPLPGSSTSHTSSQPYSAYASSYDYLPPVKPAPPFTQSSILSKHDVDIKPVKSVVSPVPSTRGVHPHSSVGSAAKLIHDMLSPVQPHGRVSPSCSSHAPAALSPRFSTGDHGEVSSAHVSVGHGYAHHTFGTNVSVSTSHAPTVQPSQVAFDRANGRGNVARATATGDPSPVETSGYIHDHIHGHNATWTRQEGNPAYATAGTAAEVSTKPIALFENTHDSAAATNATSSVSSLLDNTGAAYVSAPAAPAPMGLRAGALPFLSSYSDPQGDTASIAITDAAARPQQSRLGTVASTATVKQERTSPSMVARDVFFGGHSLSNPTSDLALLPQPQQHNTPPQYALGASMPSAQQRPSQGASLQGGVTSYELVHSPSNGAELRPSSGVPMAAGGNVMIFGYLPQAFPSPGAAGLPRGSSLAGNGGAAPLPGVMPVVGVANSNSISRLFTGPVGAPGTLCAVYPASAALGGPPSASGQFGGPQGNAPAQMSSRAQVLHYGPGHTLPSPAHAHSYAHAFSTDGGNIAPQHAAPGQTMALMQQPYPLQQAHQQQPPAPRPHRAQRALQNESGYVVYGRSDGSDMINYGALPPSLPQAHGHAYAHSQGQSQTTYVQPGAIRPVTAGDRSHRERYHPYPANNHSNNCNINGHPSMMHSADFLQQQLQHNVSHGVHQPHMQPMHAQQQAGQIGQYEEQTLPSHLAGTRNHRQAPPSQPHYGQYQGQQPQQQLHHQHHGQHPQQQRFSPPHLRPRQPGHCGHKDLHVHNGPRAHDQTFVPTNRQSYVSHPAGGHAERFVSCAHAQVPHAQLHYNRLSQPSSFNAGPTQEQHPLQQQQSGRSADQAPAADAPHGTVLPAPVPRQAGIARQAPSARVTSTSQEAPTGAVSAFGSLQPPPLHESAIYGELESKMTDVDPRWYIMTQRGRPCRVPNCDGAGGKKHYHCTLFATCFMGDAATDTGPRRPWWYV